MRLVMHWQLPLPAGISECAVLAVISADKDVDGLNPVNVGALALRGEIPRFVACTPLGCMELLRRIGVALSGKVAVVLGRSNIVGTPLCLLLQQADATVLWCHSKTTNTEEMVRQADVVVVAVGKPELVRASWLKPGAVVVDVECYDGVGVVLAGRRVEQKDKGKCRLRLERR